MKRYWGRIAGVVVGSLAGAPGIAFGLLSGWLVDQYRGAAPVTHRLDQFIRRPDREPRVPVARLYTAVTLLSYVCGEDVRPRTDRVAQLLVPLGGGRHYSEALLEHALARASRIDPARIAADAGRTFSSVPGGADSIIPVILDGAVPPGEAVPLAVARRMRHIASLLAVSAEMTARVEARVSVLDRESCIVLGVECHAEREEIRRAYRRLAADFHPDTGSSLGQRHQQEMHDAFLRIQEAYEVLNAQLDARGRNGQ